MEDFSINKKQLKKKSYTVPAGGNPKTCVKMRRTQFGNVNISIFEKLFLTYSPIFSELDKTF